MSALPRNSRTAEYDVMFGWNSTNSNFFRGNFSDRSACLLEDENITLLGYDACRCHPVEKYRY